MESVHSLNSYHLRPLLPPLPLPLPLALLLLLRPLLASLSLLAVVTMAAVAAMAAPLPKEGGGGGQGITNLFWKNFIVKSCVNTIMEFTKPTCIGRL